jgi:hypothetical protein
MKWSRRFKHTAEFYILQNFTYCGILHTAEFYILRNFTYCGILHTAEFYILRNFTYCGILHTVEPYSLAQLINHCHPTSHCSVAASLACVWLSREPKPFLACKPSRTALAGPSWLGSPKWICRSFQLSLAPSQSLIWDRPLNGISVAKLLELPFF